MCYPGRPFQVADHNSPNHRLGLGSILPKDVADGSFTRRAPTSNDKLLEQLIGKKAAKAHLAKKEASKSKVKQEKSRRPAPAPKKEESEDEEEGRASAFKSKKRKVEKPKPAAVDVGEESDDLAKVPDADLPLQPANNVKSHEHGAGGEAATKLDLGVREDDSTTEEKAPRQRSSKPKTGSYLDEILAERSKKKKKKKRNKQKDDA